MNSSSEFSSVWAKFGRAKEHIETLENEIKPWLQTDPYRLTKKSNADFTTYAAIIHVNNPPDLQRWSLIASDAIHNLRCALDHLIYAVAILRTKRNPPPSWNKWSFPVCDNASFFQSAIGRLRKLSPGVLEGSVLEEIKRFQPYNRPHPRLPPVLSLLGEFDNSNKHRLLNLVIAQLWGVQANHVIDPTSTALPGEPFKLVVNTSEVVDGAEIASYIFESPSPDADPKFEANIVISVTNPLQVGQDRLELPDVLAELVREVRSIIDRLTSLA